MIAKKRKNLNKNVWRKYFIKICIKSLIVWNNFFIRIAVLLYLDSNLEKQFYLIKIILLIDERNTWSFIVIDDFLCISILRFK